MHAYVWGHHKPERIKELTSQEVKKWKGNMGI